LDDLVGQQHVTETLKNAIKNDRVAHAYIFSGARGVGKTTAARILAKSSELRAGPDSHALRCVRLPAEKSRRGIRWTSLKLTPHPNRGIDQIRELRENGPIRSGGFRAAKFVILDEAHMLTGEASNAFTENSRGTHPTA